ncbi:MAG: tetratricopeptide repeat protein [Candidatus Acidiferrum sp.]
MRSNGVVRGFSSVTGAASCLLACTLITWLITCDPASAQVVREQIAQHEQTLAEARAAKHVRDVATELNTLGGLYREAGDTQKALDYYNQALTIEHEGHNRGAAALTQDYIARVYTDTGEEQKALDLYNETLPVWRETHNRRGEALALNGIGKVYSDLAQEEKALEYLNQALPIWREVGGGHGEATTLNNLGRVYFDTSRAQQALEFFNQALPRWREAHDRNGEALTLDNLGRAYSDLGQRQKTIDCYGQALAIWREQGNRQGEASTLNGLGRVYSELADREKALEYYTQALPVWQEVRNRAGVALTLNNIGRVYFDLRQNEKALDYYKQALPVWREVGDRRGETLTLNNLGRVYSAMGDKEKALEFDYQALGIWREVQSTRGEALALSSIARASYDLGKTENVLPNELAAFSLAMQAGDPELRGNIATALMIYFREQKQPEEAILFGTDAVNSFQQIRKNISGLDEELQAGFAQAKSGTYRQLAELLVESDRLGEAERVLDLLKEQELKEVVRGAGDNPAAKTAPLPLSSAQTEAQTELAAPEKTAIALTDLNIEYATLDAKTPRTPAEDTQFKALEARIEAGNREVSDFFRKTLYPQLAQKTGAQEANERLSREKSDVSELQNTLAQLGPRVMGIRLLFGSEHVYAMVVTAHTRERFELRATPDELRSKVLQVRDDLRSPFTNPKTHLAELYVALVAPLAEELKALEKIPHSQGDAQQSVPTLLWSLDGVLRYLPVNALYDGNHYMVERFNNVLFTPESYGHMTAPADANATILHALAMGLSKSYGGLPALPGVLPELESVVHDPAQPESHGPMEGKLLPDEQFTLAALKAELGAGKPVPVVHIASHFIEDSATGAEPFLMLGGESSGNSAGYELTLSEMEDSTISFHDTHLLTLSACSTAKGDAAKDGMEMDSLGMIAQRKDAQAVLASLWDVNDASTSRLMSDFYARWVQHPADGKAEALRQAQLALLDSSAGAAAPATKSARPAGYAHPFFWAPFVLIGNYH